MRNLTESGRPVPHSISCTYAVQFLGAPGKSKWYYLWLMFTMRLIIAILRIYNIIIPTQILIPYRL